MRALFQIGIILVRLGSAHGADLTPQQSTARSASSADFRRILADAAGRDGKLGLTIEELELAIGKADYFEENAVLIASKKRIYVLSGGRCFHVNEWNGGVSLAAVTIKGKKGADLVWK